MELGKVNTNSANAQRSFYDFVGYVDNMETNMSKFFVATDEKGQQKILTDLAVQSNLADAALSELPIKDESKYLTSKYINQVGDYSKYLNNRLIDGYSLTEEEMNNMKEDEYKYKDLFIRKITVLRYSQIKTKITQLKVKFVHLSRKDVLNRPAIL